jgi:endonuclease YncB( thermonuclease family)
MSRTRQGEAEAVESTIGAMQRRFRNFLYGGCAGLLAVCAVRAQNTAPVKPVAQECHFHDYSRDPCGNPMVESQLWQSLEGKVLKIVDNRTILLARSDDPKSVRVHPAGIAVERRGPFSRQARKLLEEILLNKSVSVLVQPGKDKLPGDMTGVISLNEGAPKDVGLVLLAEGLARFKQPRPYSISHYTQCQYRRAEAEAQSKKSGLWR